MACLHMSMISSNRMRMRWAWLYAFCFVLTLEAVGNGASAPDTEQTSIVVYLHPVATKVQVLVDDLIIHETGDVFGVWCYQFNLTSFLDTKPRKVEIRTAVGNQDWAYCDIEVRRMAGNPSRTTVLAAKTVRPTNLKNWNRLLTALSIEIALPNNCLRPLWSDGRDVDLRQVVRNSEIEVVKEVFSALQRADFDSLMRLTDVALTDQALMEGVSPALLKQAMRKKLKRYCRPGIPVSETMRAYYDGAYSDRMAPLNFDGITYSFMKDPGRAGKGDNLFSPDDVIRFSTRLNQVFVCRLFLSYTNRDSNECYVSRFMFDRVE